jgi:serine/threonine protein kinase
MPTTLGKYQLGKTLGSGVSCKVKLAKDASGTRYAVKILHKDEQFQELIKTEVESLKNLKHPNIVNLVEVGHGVCENPKKSPKSVDYIVLELVQGGELFDFVALSGRFNENVARYYFSQLMEALNYMHSAGACHRDLKPENIMLDSDFNLKVADFGFAAPALGRDGSGFLTT